MEKTIEKKDLKDGHYYIGEGRFTGKPCVGYWHAKRDVFYGIGVSFGQMELNSADYGEGGFSPKVEIEGVEEVAPNSHGSIVGMTSIEGKTYKLLTGSEGSCNSCVGNGNDDLCVALGTKCTEGPKWYWLRDYR